jgi:hypothetical protein
VDVTPSARRLTGSLRDIGYDFVAALADVVDNSVAADASTVDVEIVFRGADSYVLIADNGSGMVESSLLEALRFGTRRDYEWGELGRYGLGLKTASISQCRRLSVVTRRSPTRRRIAAKTLDLAHIEETDRWEVIDPPADCFAFRSLDWLNDGPGTVVVWEDLDRVLPENRPDSGWARRRFDQLAERSRAYLGMVFHRFLDGEADRETPLTITINGEKARPWNPFAPLEEDRIELPALSHEMTVGDMHGWVRLHRYVLPPRSGFSSMEEFERLAGPQKWNRQQGLYVYRADRLIQHGGWSGVRALDEHTKLARAALDFQTDLDTLFQINVAKMRVSLPSEVRSVFERPIHELCHRADAIYRRESDADRSRSRTGTESEPVERQSRPDASGVGAALMSAALEAGEHASLTRIMDRLRAAAPEMAASLGW